LERLKELDAFQLLNLGGYTPIYPPMRKSPLTGGLEVDEQRLNYYKTFLDHAKKFMMDFKVSNTNNDDGGQTTKGPKNSFVPDTAKGNIGKPKPSIPGVPNAPAR
jgi:hypothetical protein